MLFRLIVLTGPLRNQRITVDVEPMAIGRGADCQIVLPDDEVAAKHAILEHRPEGGLRICDLGTMHRILVNGREVRDARLKHGDMVEIGRTRFLVQAVVQAEVDRKNSSDPEERGNPKLYVALLVVLVLAVVTVMRWPKTHPGKNEKQQVELPPPAPAVEPSEPTSGPPVVVTATQIVEEVKTQVVEVVPAPSNATAIASGTQSTQMTEELMKLQADMLAMRNAMKNMVHPTVATSPPPAAVVTSASPATASPPVKTNETPVVAPAGRIIRILNVDQTRFPVDTEFDEMRSYTIELSQTMADVQIQNDALKITMRFFDEDDANGRIYESVVAQPLKNLLPSEPWGVRRRTMVNATYAVPKGARLRAHDAGHYFGFTLRIDYAGRFQDEWDQPKMLAGLSGRPAAGQAGATHALPASALKPGEP